MDMLCIVVEICGICTRSLYMYTEGLCDRRQSVWFYVQWSWIQDQVTWYSEHLGRCFVVAKDCITRCDMSPVNVRTLLSYVHCMYVSTLFHHWCRGRMCGTQGSLWGCSTSRGWGVMRNGRRWDYAAGASVCGWYIFSAVWWISGVVVVFGDNGTVNVGNRSVQTSYNTLYIHSTIVAVRNCILYFLLVLNVHTSIAVYIWSQIVQIFTEMFPPKEFPPPHILSPGTIHITSMAVSVSVFCFDLCV